MKSIRRNGNSYISAVDIINIILGILIVVSSVFLFVNIREYEKLFFVIFILAAVLNTIMGVKYYKRNDAPRMIALFAFALILLILAVASFISLWL